MRKRTGKVTVSVDRGLLRLRWSWCGQRFSLATGLTDTPTHQVIAQAKAQLIQRDIVTEQFDPTLERYQMQTSEGVTVVELWQKFTEFKARSLDPDSLPKYRGLESHLQPFFRRQQAALVGEEMALKFRDRLLTQLEPVTVRERLTLLRSCWNWALRKGWVKDNPWLDVKVKVPPRQKPKPFTTEEKRLILQGFREDKQYSYLADFVEFVQATGCRPGEAAGLKWKHLSQDCSEIWIGESWSRGRQKPTKTNRDRSYTLTKRLQEMLQRRRPVPCSPEARVFPAKKGGARLQWNDAHIIDEAYEVLLSKQHQAANREWHSQIFIHLYFHPT